MRHFFRELVKFFYNKIRYTKLAEALEEQLEIESYSGVTMRHYEYPFGITEIVNISKKKKIGKILDAGSFGSPFGPILAGLGFSVVGVDVVDWTMKHPGFSTIVADLKNLPLDDESFDIVSAISTIEHCGVPRFSETVDRDGDIHAMEEIYRVVKRNGHCILTVPYAGKFRLFHNKHRIYDKKRWDKLRGKFRVSKVSFYAPINDPRIFEPCTEAEINKINPYKNGTCGVICAVLTK